MAAAGTNADHLPPRTSSYSVTERASVCSDAHVIRANTRRYARRRGCQRSGLISHISELYGRRPFGKAAGWVAWGLQLAFRSPGSAPRA